MPIRNALIIIFYVTVAELGEGPGGPGQPYFWWKKKKWLKEEKPAAQVK